MLLRASLLLAASLLIAATSASRSPCEQGYRYWCTDETSATECGVLAWCRLMWKAGQAVKSTKLDLESQAQRNELLAAPMFEFWKRILERTNKADKQAVTSEPDAAPVEVTLYFESYCPGCKQWILSTAYPAFEKLQSSGILKLTLVPYGNAQERASAGGYTFYCQHGAAECYGNKIETCAIHHMVDQNTWFPFIRCLEYYGPTDTNAQYCSSLAKFDYTVIRNCANGAEGTQLEHQMALKTNALNPRHAYVPWLTLNGYHTDAIQNALMDNMVAYVCSAYTGTKPAACSRAATKEDLRCFKKE